MHQVAQFVVEHYGFIDADGRVVAPLPPFAAEADTLASLYRAMVLTRAFDAKAVMLQRTGRLGTFASSLGQEAVAVGAAAAMEASDVLVPSFREQGAQLLRGVTMLELLLYWGGDERGSDFSVPREDFPISIPVGSHAAHAAGVGLAMKLRAEPRAVVCIFGDGATSKGDVYEAMNFSGVHALPVVFVVNNNQWAISVPRGRQSACQTLAQKAIGAGIVGCQVDGNDVVAVRKTVADALAAARGGEGPALIEALTYRLGDHTTADDASRYRDDEEVSAHWAAEPVARMRTYLTSIGRWTKSDEEQLLAACAAEVDAAAEQYLATPPESPQAMFDHLYAVLPDALVAQREDALARARAAVQRGQ